MTPERLIEIRKLAGDLKKNGAWANEVVQELLEYTDHLAEQNQKWYTFFEEGVIPEHHRLMRVGQAGLWLYHAVNNIHDKPCDKRTPLMTRRLKEAMLAFNHAAELYYR